MRSRLVSRLAAALALALAALLAGCAYLTRTFGLTLLVAFLGWIALHRPPQGWRPAVLAAAIVVALLLPGPSDWIHGVFASGMSAFARGGVFLMRSVTETLAQAGVAVRWFRLIGDVLMQPALFLAVTAAIATCAALLGWLRPREARDAREVTHVGLLGL